MQMFDLSVTLGEGVDVYPGDPPFSAVLASRFDQNGYNLLNLTMGAHTGTHIDLPRHFLRDGYCITDVPPERFAAPAVFIDVSRQVRDTGAIDLAHADLSAVLPGDFLVIRTGWEELRGTAGFFAGLPLFVPGTAELLADMGVRLLGMDLPTVLMPSDAPSSGPPPEQTAMHTALLSRDILILEGLVGLAPLTGRRLWLFCLPLKIEGGDGSPVRAVAVEF